MKRPDQSQRPPTSSYINSESDRVYFLQQAFFYGEGVIGFVICVVIVKLIKKKKMTSLYCFNTWVKVSGFSAALQQGDWTSKDDVGHGTGATFRLLFRESHVKTEAWAHHSCYGLV